MVGVETCDAYLVVWVLLAEAHRTDNIRDFYAECEEVTSAPR